MAIVNRTRDAFFDEGRTWDLDAAVLAGREAAADGADIIDVGGVKFAPGEPLPVAEEIDRVIPVIRALREQLPGDRSEEHTSELQSRGQLVCRLLLEKKNRFHLKRQAGPFITITCASLTPQTNSIVTCI